MPRAAVICEFNPFHNGHKFLLEKIKNEYADEIVCIMSGSFVQRGDIAVTDKYARAEAALQNGADMVIELPTAYALSGAGTFADSGVRIAAAVNCDRLIFGAENTIRDLREVTDLLENKQVNDRIRAEMKSGQYYPKALSMALGEKHAGVVSRPNNILALEYIRACEKYGILPAAIPRRGASHDGGEIIDGIASAGKIRELIESGQSYQQLTPMRITDPCHIKSIEAAVLYRLKTIEPEELRQIADVGEGIENRIIEAAKQSHSLSEICQTVKTKRYTMARIRRIVLAAFLSITAEMQRTPVPYLRILGVRNGFEGILRDTKLPLIVKTKADVDALDDSAKEIFKADLRAAEAMNIAANKTISEFSQPVIKL